MTVRSSVRDRTLCRPSWRRLAGVRPAGLLLRFLAPLDLDRDSRASARCGAGRCRTHGQTWAGVGEFVRQGWWRSRSRTQFGAGQGGAAVVWSLALHKTSSSTRRSLHAKEAHHAWCAGSSGTGCVRTRAEHMTATPAQSLHASRQPPTVAPSRLTGLRASRTVAACRSARRALERRPAARTRPPRTSRSAPVCRSSRGRSSACRTAAS
jgi:hypothetical protein